MEVVEARSAMLSNYEVFKLLQDQEQYQIDQHNKSIATGDNSTAAAAQTRYQESLLMVQFQILQQLRSEPSSKQSDSCINECLERLKKYKLTKAEKLQIVNLRPASMVELHLIVEECEERFAENEMDDIIDIATSTLPGGDDDEQQQQQQQ
ncbi:calcitonin gene-related peptide-receptor component protein [Ramicandelaber brevisporus]|nr:calcitonin gene-related peptide-receptor component protein [Ramicandelaber brevisporus]